MGKHADREIRVKGIWCQHCKKTIGYFIKNSTLTNGRISYFCRECNTKRMKEYRNTSIGKKRTKSANIRTTKKHYGKQMARLAVYRAVKAGKLYKPSRCEDCGNNESLFAHHPDYSKPLDVLWLCRGCHALIHKK